MEKERTNGLKYSLFIIYDYQQPVWQRITRMHIVWNNER